MKKLLSLILVVIMVLCCASFAMAEDKPTITIWTTGSQNVGDLFTELVDTYNAQSEKYTAVNQFILSGTGEEGLRSRFAAAYASGQTETDFDIIVDGSGDFQAYVDEAGSADAFIDIDFAAIPGYENVTIVPAVDYANKMVAYRGTTVVFAYDSARVSEDELPHTWDELTSWIHAHPGRFAYNEPDTGGAGKAFVQAAVYRFLPEEAQVSNDVAWVDQYQQGLDWLIDIHPDLYQSGGSVLYPNKNQGTLDLLINQEVDFIPAWADQILSNVASGTLPATTCMYQLDDYKLSGSDACFFVPSIGSNVEGAYDFISFCVSPAGQKIVLENIKGIPVIPPEMIESDEKELVASIGSYGFISMGNLWSENLYPMWMENILPL